MSRTSTACAIELVENVRSCPQPVPSKEYSRGNRQGMTPASQDGSHRRQSRAASFEPHHDLAESGGQEVNEATAVEVTQRWSEPSINKYRVLSCFFSMLVIGANDAAYGALIPYLEESYNLTHTIVSLVFLSPFAGYIASAALSNHLHLHIGQRGIALLAPACHLASYVLNALHPPYPVLVVSFVLAGFGNGVGDAAWNAWVGGLANAGEILGFLHAFYGVGGVVGPLVATAVIAKGGWEWFCFYYVMISLSVIELISLSWSFWECTGKTYRAMSTVGDAETSRKASLKDALFHRPGARVAWLAGTFLVVYIGIGVALGGWIVTFMMRERHAEAFASGMAATGFWLGIAVGRAVLGFVTPRIGLKLAVIIYTTLAIALQLIFWLVPHFYVSAVAVALQGFFLGPLFPALVLLVGRILPRRLHVVVIGFAIAFGGCGAATLPFGVGVLAQSSGVGVLQPVVLGGLVLLLGVWVCLPGGGKVKG